MGLRRSDREITDQKEIEAFISEETILPNRSWRSASGLGGYTKYNSSGRYGS